MPREDAPVEFDGDLKSRVKAHAEKYGFIINDHYNSKMDWMEQHGGRCFCDPFTERRCPCDSMFEDMKRFGGGCLCSVFMTPERFARFQKSHETPKTVVSEEEKSKRRIRREQKYKESLKQFSKMMKK